MPNQLYNYYDFSILRFTMITSTFFFLTLVFSNYLIKYPLLNFFFNNIIIYCNIFINRNTYPNMCVTSDSS